MKINAPVMLAALVLVSACSTAPELTAVPPSEGCLSRGHYDVVHDAASGTIVHSTSGACVRSNWIVDFDPCLGGATQAPPDLKLLSQEDQTVYFGFNEASLSPEMIARLDALVANLKANGKVTGVSLVGFADRIGNAGYNEKLSKKRAENVRQYLVAKGLVSTKLAKTKWVGSKHSKSVCPPNLKRAELIECLKKDRRVEIVVEYAPDIHAGK